MRISDWSSDVCSSDLVAPFAERFLERRLRRRARGFHPLEHRAFLELQPDPERARKKDDREDEGKPPTPGVEGLRIDEEAKRHDEGRGEDQPDHRGGLDAAAIEAAISGRDRKSTRLNSSH